MHSIIQKECNDIGRRIKSSNYDERLQGIDEHDRLTRGCTF